MTSHSGQCLYWSILCYWCNINYCRIIGYWRTIYYSSKTFYWTTLCA